MLEWNSHDDFSDIGAVLPEKMAGERQRTEEDGGAEIKATGFALWKWIITKWRIRPYCPNCLSRDYALQSSWIMEKHTEENLYECARCDRKILRGLSERVESGSISGNFGADRAKR